MIHEHLEYGGSIAESKEHDGGFKQAHVGNEHSLPLVFSNMNVVVPPSDVKLGEQGGFFHIINDFQDKR